MIFASICRAGLFLALSASAELRRQYWQLKVIMETEPQVSGYITYNSQFKFIVTVAVHFTNQTI